MIVVGAGIAGLGAARTLAEAGKRTLLLEARERIGGRIYTLPASAGELSVELGAEFIHGLPQELLDLVDEAGLTRFEMEGEVRCSNGAGLGPCEDHHEADQFFEALGDAEPTGDMTFNQFLASRGLSAAAAARARDYVEGFNAADADRISLLSLIRQQAAEDAISGDRGFRVQEGYGQVPAFLLKRFETAGGELLLSAAVRSVIWKPNEVEVTSGDGRVFWAQRLLLTLPLGVLQSRSVVISPAPEPIYAAADQLAMGHALHMVYEFDGALSAVFPALDGAGFILAPTLTPPVWWTTHPRPSPMVTGWVAGRKAESVDVVSLPEEGLAALARLVGCPPADVQKRVVRRHLHDWSKDPYALGAYTWVPAGAIRASDELSVPVDDTLFFAGEHSDTSGHWGTVHGALRSGYRAAHQILDFV